MKKILLVYGIIAVGTITNLSAQIKQGIAGKVYLRQGNYMPSPGRKIDNGKPVSTTVFIYQLTKREQAMANGSYFDRIQTKLIAKAQSSSDGSYSVELPPGNYSVFVDDDHKLYANSFDGNGHISPVEVKADSITVNDIIISSKAVY
jgi:hypothetical protein